MQVYEPLIIEERIGGIAYETPSLSMRHSLIRSNLLGLLRRPLRARWRILVRPELHIAGDTLVPDLAAWPTRSRLPAEWRDVPTPSWICEIAHPVTEALDLLKLAVYARSRVPHAWLVDPTEEILDVLELDGASYRSVQISTASRVRAAPFDDLDLEVAALWRT